MRLAAAAAVTCMVLAGCSTASSPEAELQAKANDVVTAANDGDAAALRTAGGRLLEVIEEQSANGDIASTKAQNLKVFTNRILANAGLLEATEAPSPSPSPRPSPSASPSASPSPSPQPSPSPSPEEPTDSPSPEDSSGPGLLPSFSPQPGPLASSEAQPGGGKPSRRPRNSSSALA